MAKRKSARKPRKKVQKTSSFLSTVKRMFIGAFIVVACFIGVLFIYDYFVPMAGHKPVALEKKGQEVVSSKKAATCLLYTSPSPRDAHESRMPSSA